MKKLFALLLIISVLFCLSACRKEEPKVEFTLGEVDGQTYENEFLGMGFRLDKQWTLYPSDKIKDPQTKGEEQCAVYAKYNGDNLRLWIYFEEMDAEELQALDTKEYCGKNLLYRTIGSDAGFDDVSVEIGEHTLDGMLARHLKSTGFYWEHAETKGFQAVFAVKCDGYVALIRLRTNERSEIMDIMDHFYWLED